MGRANIKQSIDQSPKVDQISRYDKKSPQEKYARIVIELDDPQYVGHNIEIKVSGSYLNKIFYDGSPDVFIKLNHRHSGKIFITEFRRIHIEFDRIYLTNPVSQPGRKLIFVVGDIFTGEIEPSIEDFSGIPYLKTVTTTDLATPFETVTTRLRSVVINNKHNTFSALIGTYTSQIFELEAGGTVGLDNIDMNLLYYRSKVTGSHPTLKIIGTYIKY